MGIYPCKADGNVGVIILNLKKDEFGQNDYAGFENENFKIIGYTGEKNHRGLNTVLVFNKHTEKYETRFPSDVILNKISGRPSNIANRRNKYPGVKKRRNKFEADIHIKETTYYLGIFKTPEEASERYQQALKEWQNEGKLPFKAKPKADSEKNVHYQEQSGNWIFQKRINKKAYTKSFPTKEQAIAYKQSFLEEKGLK